SKVSAKACFSSSLFASTWLSASFSVCRSSKPTRSITLPASIDSEVDTRISADRSARMKSPRTSLMGASPRLHGLCQQRVHLAIHIVDVVLELEEDIERVADKIGVELARMKENERARPVDGFADRRKFLEVELAEPL